MKKNKTLVIGWDAADWKFLNPLIDQGLMPNLERLVNGGVMGKLATLDPPLSPTLWTSIATGKRPYKHGIHGFTEPRPDGKGLRPMNITSRKCKAIWNIFTQHDLKTHVVGWWPSHPAEPINGVMVSNFYQRSKRNDMEWPMMKGTVHPADKAELFSKLRVHVNEITGNHVEPLVPNIANINQYEDKQLANIPTLLADCASIHSAATYILENEDWDFVGVYYDGIDHFCHDFMKYHPPHRPHIPLKDFENYKDVINGACRFHDMMLGRLMELAGPDTNIILLSDHGFHPDHNRPIVVPKEPMGPAVEHSPYGIIVMNGPDFKKDELIHGASLLDITPTLLHLYGLPVGKDMDGKVLVNAFADTQKVATIDSWEDVAGNDGRHPEGYNLEEQDSDAELQQLIDLGYIEDHGDDYEKAIERTLAENNFTLAKAYMDGQKWEEGIALLEELHQAYPDQMHYCSRLIYCYQLTGQLKKARAVTDSVKAAMPHRGVQLELLEGSLLFSENKPKAALRQFQKIKAEAGDYFQINLRIADAYRSMNEMALALEAVNEEIALSPENERAYYLKGRILSAQGQYELALKALLEAAGLDYHNPSVHFMIGKCLQALKQYEDAIKAYEVCVVQSPVINKAREQIIYILRHVLEQPGRAKRYEIALEDQLQGTITIVSGLPRSGTSLMMQMLEAGGMQVFTDDVRTADQNNLKGYYEHEAVKSLQKKNGFLKDATDQAVKVIANLLPYLPSRYKYRVVFMTRDLDEVIRSQQKMLIRDGKRLPEDVLPLALVNKFDNSLKKARHWLDNQRNVEYVEVDYHDLLQNPFEQAIFLNNFFAGQLQPEKMAGIPDPTLYRERHAQPATTIKQ
ncbi:MAG: alkaline phosphatase family protein [Bacteroidota bacterium]